MRRRITIVGAGNLGIACAARFSGKGVAVTLFTGHPELWPKTLIAEDCNGCRFEGELLSVTDDPRQAVAADLIFLCLPGNAIREKLLLLRPYLVAQVPIASVYSGDGFFFVAEELLGASWPVMGFQRVPFICRIRDTRKVVGITGYKKELFFAHRNITNPDSWRMFFQAMMDTKTTILSNFYEAAFVNGNVILHPARLMSLQTQIDSYGPIKNSASLFYEDWNDVASEWAIRLDQELRAVAHAYGASICPFLEYYESSGISSLSAKIRSIPAFKGICSPLTADGLIDKRSRYFLADVEIALAFVVRAGYRFGVPCKDSTHVLKVLGAQCSR